MGVSWNLESGLSIEQGIDGWRRVTVHNLKGDAGNGSWRAVAVWEDGRVRSKRHGESNPGTAWLSGFEIERVLVSVEMLEAGASIREPHAFDAGRFVWRGKTLAVVDDLDLQFGAKMSGSDGDDSGSVERFKAVADGILHERLEDERWDKRFERRWIDLEIDGQSVSEAGFFDVEVAREKGHFLAERGLVAVGGVERVAEQIAEPCDGAIGGLWVLMNERGDGVQCIEQKVGVELHAQGFESGLDELGFELSGAEFAFGRALIEVPSVMPQDHHEVDADDARQIMDDQFLHAIEELERDLFDGDLPVQKG